MKIIKPRYDYLLLLYFPIVAVGFALTFFFTPMIITAFAISGGAFFIAALIIAFSPLGKQTIPGIKLNTKQWLGRLWALQLGSGFVYWVFQASTPPGTLTPLSFPSGLYPWPLYLLFAIALTYFQGSLKISLQPISKGIVNVGADLFMKQSLFFIAAFTLAIFIQQIYQMPIGLHFQTLVLGTILSMAVVSPFWRRYIHFLWHERYTAKTFLFTTILLIISIIFIFNIITVYFPTVKPPAFQFINNIMYWPLLKFVWWLAWAPLAVQLLRSLICGRQVRQVIIVGLIVPFLLSLLMIPFPAPYPFAIISMGLVIYFFQDNAIAQLLFAARGGDPNNPRISLSALRNMLFLIVATFTTYTLTELALLAPFAFSLSAPCFFAICAACSSYVLNSYKSKLS